MPIDLDAFARLRPFLFHLTARQNLAHIRSENRLLSASLLAAGDPVLQQRRARAVPVKSAGRGCVMLRDQQPLNASKLTFTGDWGFDELLRALNDRVFFWQGRCNGTPIDYGRRHFAKYEGTDVVVLRVPTAAVLAEAQPEFSKVNSGAAGRYPGQSRRGPDTFLPAAQCPLTPSQVVEVTFRGSVRLPDGVQIGPTAAGPFRALRP